MWRLTSPQHKREPHSNCVLSTGNAAEEVIGMAEESGKVKIMIEVEFNEALMNIAKEGMEAIPGMIKATQKEDE